MVRNFFNLVAVVGLFVTAACGSSTSGRETLSGQPIVGDWLLVATTPTNNSSESAMPVNSSHLITIKADGQFEYRQFLSNSLSTGTISVSGSDLIMTWSGGSSTNQPMEVNGDSMILRDNSPTTSIRIRRYRFVDSSEREQIIRDNF